MFLIITSYKKEGLDEKKHENKKLSNKSIQCQKEKNIIFNSTKMHVFVDDCDIFQTRGSPELVLLIWLFTHCLGSRTFVVSEKKKEFYSYSESLTMTCVVL